MQNFETYLHRHHGVLNLDAWVREHALADAMAGLHHPWLRPFSPSLIKEKRKCFRRATFKRIERLPDPAGPAAVHGGRMHTQLEHWLLYGKMPVHIDALAAMREAPRPLTALAETTIRWQHDDPWSYLGIMDFSAALLSKARFETSPFFEPGATLVIGDYKFTSNLKYALAELNGLLVDAESLEPDPQSVMYADHYFQRGFDDIHGKWIYTETKHAAGKRPRVRPVWVHFSRERVEEAMCGVRADAADLYQLYRIRPKANDVPYNKAGCYAFGQPCPYLFRCSRPEAESMFSSSDTDPGEEDMTAFADTLTASFPLDEDDLPPVPDEDLPDVPAGEEEPPAVPDEDGGEGMSEEERRELIAAELAHRKTIEGTVEKGFVNAPGEPETVARNPEEHAERYADPVEPKAPKEPAFRFTKKHRPALLEKCIELGLADAATTVTATGLAKLLRGAKVDPTALVGIEVVSQGAVDEEELPLVPDEDPEASNRDVMPLPPAEVFAPSPDLPLISQAQKIEAPAAPEAVSDVSEIRVEWLNDRALREFHERAVAADAQDAPGAAEVVEKCEAEMERRGGFGSGVARKVSYAPLPGAAPWQGARVHVPGARVHVPGAVEPIDIGPVKMSVGGVELKPDAFADSLEAGARELDGFTAELKQYEMPKTEAELRSAFALLGNLARESGARITITFGE